MSGDSSGALGVVIMAVAAASVLVPIVIAVVVIALILVGLKLAFMMARDLIDPPAARAVRRVERDRDAAILEMIETRRDAVRRMQKISAQDVIDGRAWDE
jgi:uncharacterized protein involved in cysteine biosynthesis